MTKQALILSVLQLPLNQDGGKHVQGLLPSWILRVRECACSCCSREPIIHRLADILRAISTHAYGVATVEITVFVVPGAEIQVIL
jgi:hypothetical protein